ncbi:MAG: type II secretion system major pseudopilin GspG [Hyphomicrobiaceae bacterium]|nr:type II secretion system major pseudopilin GspG [Hyphomicrobiaceae bacterium]
MRSPSHHPSPARRGTAPRPPAASAGFTLIEVLVVLGILALIATFATPQVLRYLGHSRVEAARIQVSAIVTAMELYALDHGTYPTQQEGLNALVRQPAGSTRWRGPYLKKAEGMVDPWGRPYGYRVPGRQKPFEVYSLGRDNAVGGTDENQDVVGW